MPKNKRGNFRFTDKEVLPFRYRQAFLHSTEQLAPEVLESLKVLCPKWQAVINNYPYTEYLTSWLSGEFEIVDPQVEELHRRSILDYHLAVKDRYSIADSNLLPEAEELAWKNCIELRGAFAEFLEEYGLTSNWLRTGLFRLLGDLNRSPHHFNSLCYVYSHAYFPAHGEEFEVSGEGWQIEESWQEFEARTRLEFENRLAKYKSQTTRSFRDLGYKKTTKPLDLTVVKWLVYWTVKRMSKESILEMIRKERPSTMTIEDLNKTLRNLASQFDLPLRREKSIA